MIKSTKTVQMGEIRLYNSRHLHQTNFGHMLTLWINPHYKGLIAPLIKSVRLHKPS